MTKKLTPIEVEGITALPFEDRLPALIKAKLVTEVVLHVGGGGIRPIVVIDLGNARQPFYRSANGTAGKAKGKWFPFFGFGKGKYTDTQLSWMVKGTIDVRPGVNPYFHPHIKPGKINSMADFNKEVYGITERGIVYGNSEANRRIMRSDITLLNNAFNYLYLQ